MVTLHINLDEERWECLNQMAQARGLTPEQLVSEAIEDLMRQNHRRLLYEQAMTIVGKYRSGQEDISLHHDAYLGEAFTTDIQKDESVR